MKPDVAPVLDTPEACVPHANACAETCGSTDGCGHVVAPTCTVCFDGCGVREGGPGTFCAVGTREVTCVKGKATAPNCTLEGHDDTSDFWCCVPI